jgi:hypothetical protein
LPTSPTSANSFSGFGRGGVETTSRRPPGDDQYEKPCKEEFEQRMKAEDELHAANLAAATTRVARQREDRRHKLAVAFIRIKYQFCKHKRGHGRGGDEHESRNEDGDERGGRRDDDD